MTLIKNFYQVRNDNSSNSVGKIKKIKWDLLNKFLEFKYFSYIDFAIAEQFASNECQAALLCFISLSSRSGHLCVRLAEGIIEPELKSLASSDGEITETDYNQLMDLLFQAALCLDKDCNFIKSEGSRFYFPKNWSFETNFLTHIKRLEQTSPRILFESKSFNEKVDILESQKKLLPEQASAIRKTLWNSITIICGGPGTGKTYTAGQMIKLYWDSLDEHHRKNCQILLAAPTGKAAANLQLSLNLATRDLKHFHPIQATTLHSLLGVNMEGKRKDDRFLNANILVIDECSMIDAKMMGYLFASIRPSTRVILLGDKNQLPPVEAGSLFTDLMSCRPEWSVELVNCMRSELKGILNLAKAIKEGNFERCLADINSGEGVATLTYDLPDLMDYVFSYFRDSMHEDPAHLLESFNQFRVLSALRKGPLGVDEFNQQIHERAKKNAKSFQKYAEPIILTSSDTHLDLFNGEAGVIVKTKDKDEASMAFFHSRKDKSIRSIPALLLPKYEYAYCLSVHKSQGSEFDKVLFLMPPRTQYFGREVLYTAVTRAKRQLEIYGDDETLHATILRSSKRLSGIPERLGATIKTDLLCVSTTSKLESLNLTIEHK